MPAYLAGALAIALERFSGDRDVLIGTPIDLRRYGQLDKVVGMFRRVYPFSPALVQTLIAVSGMLQRERTAIKIMTQLLVEQRETLRVGDLVPVGDLFDVIADGEEAFSQEMAIHFGNAKRHGIVQQVGWKFFLQPVAVQAFHHNGGIVAAQ